MLLRDLAGRRQRTGGLTEFVGAGTASDLVHWTTAQNRSAQLRSESKCLPSCRSAQNLLSNLANSASNLDCSRALTRFKETSTCGLQSRSIPSAGRNRTKAPSRPQTRAWQEAVLQALPCQAFQIGIGKLVCFGGTHILGRHIRAQDALVVGCQGHGNTIPAIGRKRMMVTHHAKDQIVAGQADFHHNVAPRHLLEQRKGIVLVHHRYPMSDSLRVPAFDRVSNMKAQSFRRNDARRKFISM